MVDVLVEYDYSAKEPDELTIKKGDIIREVVKKSGGWWEGSLNDKKGVFPDNFVRVITKDAPVIFRNKKDSQRIRQCRVIFSYRQDHQDELNLSVGDVIDILGEEEEGWWRGLINGKEGVFPSNFVEEIKSKTASREDLTNLNESNAKSPLLPPKPIKLLCQVKYSYTAQNEDELSLKEGDIINVLSKDGEDPGWWRGEVNGQVGVFPDNFVSILSDDEKLNKALDSTVLKTPVVSAQRKSIEEKSPDVNNRVTPPVPSKKPLIGAKKSPSGSNAQGGLLAGLRKKIVDVVDGASSSKGQPVLIKANHNTEDQQELNSENAFDQVERTPMLSDVRATRAKAPGRRPPSVIFKEGEPGVLNGNTDHAHLENHNQHIPNSHSPITNNQEEVKPKVREWEKHKAPWLEEMKLNQAKRTSTSPGPETKLKLTPSEKSASPEIDDTKFNKTSPFDQTCPTDMSKSLNIKITTPTDSEKNSVMVRMKPVAQSTPTATARPQSIHSVPTTPPIETTLKMETAPKMETTLKMETTPKMETAPKTKTSPTPPQITKPPQSPKPQTAERNGLIIAQETVSNPQYIDLLLRLEKLEILVRQQDEAHKAAIEELNGKLQVETDMRMMLQAELDKVSQCVMQV